MDEANGLPFLGTGGMLCLFGFNLDIPLAPLKRGGNCIRPLSKILKPLKECPESIRWFHLSVGEKKCPTDG
jgi:hypothetical protein